MTISMMVAFPAVAYVLEGVSLIELGGESNLAGLGAAIKGLVRTGGKKILER
jgi:hypothetical protein